MSNNKKIAKFAKYGLALIAAITIATAAQSQQGNVSHRVYAEEVSQPDYDSWRMFYVYSSDYPDSPTSGSMAGRVIKPNDPYIVGDESFRDPGTYSRYEVFDDTGKYYNPGDTIAVDDPLVNHTNEEDNRLYYRYYMNPGSSEAPAPSTSPSTSEAPAPSTSPSTSEAPAPSTSPSTSEAPAPSTSPSTSEAPAPSTSPSTSEAPAPSKDPVEKPSQKADDKTTATDKAKNAKADKKADSKKAKDQVKTEKSKDATVAAKDDSTSKKAEASAPAEQAKAVKANTNANSQDNIVKEADGTVDTAAVHNDNTGFLLTVLGFVSAAFIGLRKTKKEEK